MKLFQRYFLRFAFGALLLAPFGAPIRTNAQPATPPSTSSPNAADTRAHTFEFRGADDLKSVNVAGTFNNWDKSANAMTKSADGVWRATLTLSFGRTLYKFVLNSDKWVSDPNAPHEKDDNANSILLLLPPDYARPATPRDGFTSQSALQHLTRVPNLNYDRGRLTLSLRVRPDDVRAVTLLSNNARYPMRESTRDELYATYAASLPWSRARDLNYVFELQDGAKTQQLGANGLQARAKPFHLGAKTFQPFVVPSWVEKSVFYQIFPDRFENGDKSNDPPDVAAWNAKPQYFNRFGGDVAGVRQHLDHLSNLGVSSVYFNPVFQSPSNHRYDAQDFKTIDPQFGSNAEFAALTRELDKRKIRTVMDFVFNHSATSFSPFADIRAKGQDSTFKDWYFIKSYPVEVKENPNYVAWFNYPSMPKLNLMNPPTHEYMLDLVDFWKREVPLAGLRLDVANEVDSRFWRDLRVRAKTLDANTWIVGEVWGDGTPWLGGDQWDSVMNYQFLFACSDFFADNKTTSTQFGARLMRLYNSYPPQVSRNMMNLLSSHDTPRFLTRCGNNQDLSRLAVTLQMTWVGAPSIYYGEELGMEGGADPDNRRGMEWNRATPGNAMLRYYKRLIELRNHSRALQSGDPQILQANDADNTLAFARLLPNDLAVVALNRSDTAQTLNVPIPPALAARMRAGKGYADGVAGERANVGADNVLRVTLPPLHAVVFVPVR